MTSYTKRRSNVHWETLGETRSISSSNISNCLSKYPPNLRQKEHFLWWLFQKPIRLVANLTKILVFCTKKTFSILFEETYSYGGISTFDLPWIWVVDSWHCYQWSKNWTENMENICGAKYFFLSDEKMWCPRLNVCGECWELFKHFWTRLCGTIFGMLKIFLTIVR